MLPPRYGNIPIQNADDRLDVEIEHDNRPIHGREQQPQFAAEARGGQFEYERGDPRDTSAALSRGTLDFTLEMKGGSAYVGGHSRETESNIAYERDAGYTMPRGTRREEAGNQAAIDARNVIREREAVEGRIQPPQQPEQGRGQQQEQRAQGQQREQAQAQPAQQATQEQGEKRERKPTPQEMERQNKLSSLLRGKMDALEGAGLQKFEGRKGIDNEKDFDTAKKAYQATKLAIRNGKLAEMAANADRAAGDHQPQQGQSTEMASTDRRTRLAAMANRAETASRPTPQTGTGIQRDTGLEQG